MFRYTLTHKSATYLKNGELDSEFKFRWLHFLSIVDEIRDAINDPVTRQVVGNTLFTSAVCLKIILIKIACRPLRKYNLDRYAEHCP